MAFRRFLVSGLLSVAGLCFLLLISSSASAATLNVVGGQLLGASDVIVDGTLYNVAFLDGTCIDLFSGCDEVSDFTFQTGAAALLASQALLDQVFFDGAFLFDTDPELTVGCTDDVVCRAITPYAFGGGGVLIAIAANVAGVAVDTVGFSGIAIGVDMVLVDDIVYAVWALVPEPGTAVLMGLGLLGLSVRKRREV